MILSQNFTINAINNLFNKLFGHKEDLKNSVSYKYYIICEISNTLKLIFDTLLNIRK